MLALRILAVACAIAVILALLGYTVSRDRRWLKFAGYVFKGGLAIAAIILLLMFVRRFLAM